jgi:hypothetical protein
VNPVDTFGDHSSWWSLRVWRSDLGFADRIVDHDAVIALQSAAAVVDN